MPDSDGIGQDFVDDLLALGTREQQTELLRDAGLLDTEGLKGLLDVADRLVVGDPGKAGRLAELGIGAAEAAEAPAAIPYATYILAGSHGMNGDLDEELRLTEAAYNGYVALGMNLEALRTNVGKMSALLELGRYGEALEAGQVVLDALDGKGVLPVRPTAQETDTLTAVVYGNRSICYELVGRYEEALEASAIAEERFATLGMTERLGEVISNRGLVLLRLGRGSEALAAHEAAADVLAKAGLALRHAQAIANIGETHLQLSNYASSLKEFESARRLLASTDALVDKHFVLRNTANAYLALNLHAEALATYREAEVLLRGTGMAHDQAQALWGIALALVAHSEFEQAERALDEAAALFEEAGNVPLLSGVMLERASLREARGDRTDARATAQRALELVSKDSWPVQQVYARLRLADMLLPDTTAVEPHLLAAQRLADRLALPHLRYRTNERLGHLRRLQGRDEEARTLLEAAVEEIERSRGTVAQDTMRASFLRDKTAAYEDLLQLYLAQDDELAVWRAFTVAERAKSRALVDLLSGVTEKGSSADPELDRRLRELQADLNAAYSGLLGSHDGEREMPVTELHARAVELEGEIGRLRLQAAADGSPSELFATSMPLNAIQDDLPPDAALLAYHVAGDEILAFVHARGQVRVARHLGSVAAVQRLLRKLDSQWDRFGAGREFAGRHMPLLERSARQVLASLYAELVASVEPLLEEVVGSLPSEAGSVRKLTVVPHGPLHRVPFHALFDGERYLIERFEISYAPSTTVYALCQERDARGLDGALVLGVDDPSIPAAADEARTVSKHLPGASVRVGEEATLTALWCEAPGRGALHLACHGLFRADNPMFSALKLHDGWLLASDAMGLDLDGTLVALSACESGRSEVVGGDEILGLTRAFLGAGAATLAVSLWLVQDETTADLMGDWYERLRAGEQPATALRAAQLELKERHPHPYYWAPFVLIGKR
jgi:tetratricopeptide (TPR) repeat protein